jgi:hypothetical protein
MVNRKNESDFIIMVDECLHSGRPEITLAD